MGAVKPKLYTYLFLSIICLLINLSIFVNSLVANTVEMGDMENFLDATDEDDFGFEGDLPDDTNATIQAFVLSSGTSFVPFFSFLGLIYVGSDLPTLLTVLVGIVIGIISALQVFLIALIIMNLFPKFLGSGFDV